MIKSIWIWNVDLSFTFAIAVNQVNRENRQLCTCVLSLVPTKTKGLVLTEAARSPRLPSSRRRWQDFWPRTRRRSRDTFRARARGSGKYNVVSTAREVSGASGCHLTRPEIVAELRAGAFCERAACLRGSAAPSSRPHCPRIISAMYFLATRPRGYYELFVELAVYDRARVKEGEGESRLFWIESN